MPKKARETRSGLSDASQRTNDIGSGDGIEAPRGDSESPGNDTGSPRGSERGADLRGFTFDAGDKSELAELPGIESLPGDASGTRPRRKYTRRSAEKVSPDLGSLAGIIHGLHLFVDEMLNAQGELAVSEEQAKLISDKAVHALSFRARKFNPEALAWFELAVVLAAVEGPKIVRFSKKHKPARVITMPAPAPAPAPAATPAPAPPASPAASGEELFPPSRVWPQDGGADAQPV
jgi:hypothetical protein